jgi:hypothetical protein
VSGSVRRMSGSDRLISSSPIPAPAFRISFESLVTILPSVLSDYEPIYNSTTMAYLLDGYALVTGAGT